MIEESMKDYFKAVIFDLANKQQEHQAKDNPVCEGEAAVKVFIRS